MNKIELNKDENMNDIDFKGLENFNIEEFNDKNSFIEN